MIDFIANNANVLAEFKTITDYIAGADCNVLGEETIKLLDEIYLIIKIVVPILVVLLITVDFAKAVLGAGGSKDYDFSKKAQSNAVKRISVGLAIFFLPDIIDFIMLTFGLATGICGIGR